MKTKKLIFKVESGWCITQLILTYHRYTGFSEIVRYVPVFWSDMSIMADTIWWKTHMVVIVENIVITVAIMHYEYIITDD